MHYHLFVLIEYHNPVTPKAAIGIPIEIRNSRSASAAPFIPDDRK
jgi:hypothetical protein